MIDPTPTAPVMTVQEFRKLTGKDTEHFTDAEVEKIISHLDLIAGLYVSSKKLERSKPMGDTKK